MSRQTPVNETPDIAIVGMSGRFPGAPTIDEFWRNLRDGIESRSEFTDAELAAEGVSTKVKHPRHVRAGFVLPDFDKFDAAFFGINPREAEILDPQHRLFLECAWHVLEDAGYDTERFPGQVGIWGGSTWSNYLVNNLFRSSKLIKSVGHRQLIHGSVPDYMVTRVAYRLNLRGPAAFVQTACSTSLVAVHLACRSLRSGEVDLALAGGVSVAVPHRVGYIFEEGGMESPDGHVRAFDAAAKGTVFGSGVAIVALRRLDDALRDGDHVHAVIRGTAVNNDGALKVGFTAPGVAGQAEVVAQAFADARLGADDISYIEAHGTGTELGDPIELTALTRAYRQQTARRHYCAVGSVKPNLGHLDAAAGASSLIKTVLALQHRQIPPSINFQTLNPKIELEDSPFFVNTTLREWTAPDGQPRRAGVSSFGFGGTNAHVIVEEAQAAPAAAPARTHQLLVLSARTSAARDRAASDLADRLAMPGAPPLADAAYTLQVGRRQFGFRRAVVCEAAEDAVHALHGEASRWVASGQSAGGARRVVFLFPGQGAQYVNMGRGLYETEPVFSGVVDQCAAVLQARLGFDLRETLFPPAGQEEAATAQLKRTVVTQAAVFTIELALARLWMHWGVVPAALAGHSIGEFVAACLAGVLSVEDALALVALRGQLMESMPEGAMLAVPLPEARVRELIGDGLWLAAVNSPGLSVVSGTHAAIDALQERLQRDGVDVRRLHTSHAFHSGLMDDAVAPFEAAVAAIALGEPHIPYLSNVTGGWATADLVREPGYFGRHIRQAVRFADNIAELLGTRETIFLEVGPGTTLSTFVRQQARAEDNHVVVSSLRHPQEQVPDTAVLLHALGRLWTSGVEVDWTGVHDGYVRRRARLPVYPFERQRYLVEPDKPNAAQMRRAGSAVQAEDLSDWFHVPSWKRTSLPVLAATAPSRWLVFADGRGVGDALAASLAAAGHAVTVARPGDGFHVDGTSCTLAPGAAADYQALLKHLAGEGGRPERIVHLWGVDSTEAEAADRGFYSLLFLAQALGEGSAAAPVQVTVVTTGVHDVTGEEAVVPARATVLGPARVVPQELTTVSCRHVDLVIGGGEEAAAAAALEAEVAPAGAEAAVAYRHGRRWALTYEPVRLAAPTAAAAARFEEGGTYLITGGFGGIGLVLAERLAAAHKANLVLTARKGLPARAGWAAHVERYGPNDPVSRRIAAVERLEALGAQVLVGDADVSDEPRMRAVVEEARRRFGRIHGVVHAAGVAGGGVIPLKTRDAADAVLRPKVVGTQVLGRVLEDQPAGFLVLCSSLTSLLGGVGQVDYCGANAFQDAWARWYEARTGTRTVAVNWSAWKEVGMAVDTAIHESLKSSMREQMLALGLSNAEGADAFERIVGMSRDAQVAVSQLDVQLMLDALREVAREQAETASGGAAAGGATGGTAAAGGHARPDLGTAYVAPSTDTERRIAAVWEEMLGIAGVGVNDSFFDLGGHSLLAVRVMTRLNEVMGSDVPVAKLYEGLTVGFLAGVIGGPAGGDTPAAEDDDARERRREKARRQKEHQQKRLAAARR